MGVSMKQTLMVAVLALVAAAPAQALMPVEMPRNADGGPRFADPDDQVFDNGVLGGGFGVAGVEAPSAREARELSLPSAHRDHAKWRQAYAVLSASPSRAVTVNCLDCDTEAAVDRAHTK